jgi:hypothetical protein
MLLPGDPCTRVAPSVNALELALAVELSMDVVPSVHTEPITAVAMAQRTHECQAQSIPELLDSLPVSATSHKRAHVFIPEYRAQNSLQDALKLRCAYIQSHQSTHMAIRFVRFPFALVH